MKKIMKQKDTLRPWLISLAVFAVCLGMLFYLSAKPGPCEKARQEERIRNAVWRAAIHCYAMEGRYPPSLEYMEEVYGLQIDRDVFLVEYERHGNNIAPKISVLRVDDSGGWR